jgi:histidinol-phosphate aminotransferase
MRVGIVIGQPPALQPVRDVTLPFNINVIAQTAVQAALDDAEFLPRYAAEVRESRELLYEACRRLGLPYWESAANYGLVRVGETAPFIEALSARKIHVRDRSKDPATPGCDRVTTGVIANTQAAIEALESVMPTRQPR